MTSAHSTIYLSVAGFNIKIRFQKTEWLLADNKGFILRSSAANFNEKAYLFLGKSGAGKFTIMKLLNGKYSALADDDVIVKKESYNYYLYQSPFLEKEWWIKKGGKNI